MSKVLLSKEQAEQVELVKRRTKAGNRTIEERVYEIFYDEESKELRDKGSHNDILENIGLENFIKAIHLGYEVEEPYKINDWVKDKNDGTLIKLNTEEKVEQANSEPWLSKIELATDEDAEKDWWKKHGRNPWQLKEGDILRSPYGDAYTVHWVNPELILFKEDVTRGLSYIRSRYKVACFAEDRKDI